MNSGSMSHRTRIRDWPRQRWQSLLTTIHTEIDSVRPELAAILVLVVLFLVLIIRTAWIADSAFFTFRTIGNISAGLGPVFNAGERVQAYTHPLWMFVLSAGIFFTNEFFYTTVVISIVVSLAVLFVFVRWIASSPMVALLGIATLIVAKAYIDYSTSGLENALSHLLAVMYLAVYFAARPGRWRVFGLFLVAGLAAVNRLDLLLLYLPSLIYVIWRERRRETVVAALAGLAPLILWELFSLVYYGFPFPNTAYAKLNTGIPIGEILEQGLYYLLNSMLADPITLVITLAGVLAALFVLRGSAIPIAIGIGLYLLYVVQIGGGFMSGRFLTTALLVGLALLCRVRLPDQWAVVGIALVAVVGLTSPAPTVFAEPDESAVGESTIDLWGIADERAHYFPNTGLLYTKRHQAPPDHVYGETALLVARLRRNQISGWADLNRRPLGPEPSALAPALQPVDAAILFQLLNPRI